MAAPLVSAIIVTRNRRRDLDRCLESLAAVEAPPLEIIVVDNGSDDGTVAMVRDRHPGTIVLAAVENRGTSAARNAAALRATGRYLWFLDSDTELRDPTLPCRLAAFCGADPALGGIGGEAILDERDRIVAVKTLDMLPNGLTAGRVIDAAAGLHDADCLASCNLFMPRAAFEAVGGFDPLFFFFLEDLDLSWRLRQAGYALKVLARAPVVHRLSEDARDPDPFTPKRNRVLLLLKNAPLGRVAALPLLDLAYLLGADRWRKLLHRARAARHGTGAAVVAPGSGRLSARGLAAALWHAVRVAASLPASYLLAVPHAHRALGARPRRAGRRGGGLEATDPTPFTEAP